MESAPEKTVSAVRAQMSALAEKNGYPKGVAAAMVDMDVELVEINSQEGPQLIFTEDVEALRSEAEQGGREFEVVKVVSKPGKLLAMTAGEMEYYRISSGTVNSVQGILDDLDLSSAETFTYTESLADRIISYITGSVVTSLLIMIGLGALYLEITSPGFGVPGTAAIIAFAILFGGNLLLGTAGSLEILLFLLGLILLVIEIILIPGFGAAGFSGILLILGSLVMARQDFVFPEFHWQREVLERNILTIGSGLLGSILLGGIIFRFFHRIPGLKKLVLVSTQDADLGFHVQHKDENQNLLGRRGEAVTPLRPSGKGAFGDDMLMVESGGDYIEAGRSLVIIEVRGNRIKVREV